MYRTVDYAISTVHNYEEIFLHHSTLLTYSMEHSPSSEVNRLQLDKKFPAFYATRRFITASVRHLSLPSARSIQSIPPAFHFLKIHLKLSSHLRLGLASSLYPSGFLTKTLYTPLSPSTQHSILLRKPTIPHSVFSLNELKLQCALAKFW